MNMDETIWIFPAIVLTLAALFTVTYLGAER